MSIYNNWKFYMLPIEIKEDREIWGNTFYLIFIISFIYLLVCLQQIIITHFIGSFIHVISFKMNHTFRV